MKKPGTESRTTERLMAVVVMALLLFCPPVIIVIDRLPSLNIGWLPVYLFFAWGVIIGLTAWLMEHHADR